MEEAMQQLEADQQLQTNNHFLLGLAASLFLHLVFTVALFSLPKGPPATPPAVTYIDLGMAKPPASMVAPPKEAAPEKVLRQPESTPAPEVPPQAQLPEAVPDQPAAVQATAVEEVRSHTTIGLGLTEGYFRGLGDGGTLREGIKEYYLEMLQGINEKWWLDQQLDRHNIVAVVINIKVARNGEIIGSEIMRGSGNFRYDKAVLTALASASPLPPLPSSYVGDFFQAPIRLVPPLNLMAR